MSDERVFRIGLTMAGAISAGAYTAGVFDFLIRALAEWEEARKKDPASVPQHRAPIVAMSGASAGGMTAILGTIALGHTLQPTTKKTSSGGDINCVLPSLYSAWVERVRMVSDIGPSLLSTEDVKDGLVRSILNASLLDDICNEALQMPAPPPPPPPLPTTVAPYAFLAEPLHVYVTLTNLSGTQYDISFGKEKYRMLNHGDRKHFKITGIGGDTSVASKWAEEDPSLPELMISQLNQAGGPSQGWRDMGWAALATGAFPAGLAARVMTANTADYKDRQWPVPMPEDSPNSGETKLDTVIDPTWPEGWTPSDKQFKFVAVDGGAIDNEPFELARYAIKEPGEDNPRDAVNADRAVIMVAPFPEGYSFPKLEACDGGLMAVIKKLLPTLIQQARFKPNELAAAAHPQVHSRFLIAPKRDGSSNVSSNDIACGLLGGFGGFLDQSFREHDFQLGQRNCQQFLRKFFSLPSNNKVMGGDGQPAPECHPATNLPIIPLLGSLDKDISEPVWPRMSMANFSILIKRIESRAETVVPLLLKQEIPWRVMRGITNFAWKYLPLISSKVIDTIRRSIFADLIRRDQIEDGLSDKDCFRLRSFDFKQRQVLAALAATGFDLRTIPSIAKETDQTASFVLDTLATASSVPDGAVHKVWKSNIKDANGNEGYALNSRRPSWYETVPLVGGLVRKVTNLTID
ncbi:PNPLA domain-containing protein [uncultured Gammaproteobacteria bacterium]